MYKLAKWSYQRGVMAERNRIKRVIAELQKDKPEPQHFGDDKKAKPVNDFEIAVWHQTTHELGKLLDPMKKLILVLALIVWVGFYVSHHQKPALAPKPSVNTPAQVLKPTEPHHDTPENATSAALFTLTNADRAQITCRR
jgi:hypothetical protein